MRGISHGSVVERKKKHFRRTPVLCEKINNRSNWLRRANGARKLRGIKIMGGEGVGRKVLLWTVKKPEGNAQIRKDKTHQ